MQANAISEEGPFNPDDWEELFQVKLFSFFEIKILNVFRLLHDSLFRFISLLSQWSQKKA